MTKRRTANYMWILVMTYRGRALQPFYLNRVKHFTEGEAKAEATAYANSIASTFPPFGEGEIAAKIHIFDWSDAKTRAGYDRIPRGQCMVLPASVGEVAAEVTAALLEGKI